MPWTIIPINEPKPIRKTHFDESYRLSSVYFMRSFAV